MLADISQDFRWNKRDAQIGRKLLEHEGTPEAIKLFARYAWQLSDYAYWFFLSTLWVSYTGWSDLSEWKRLFASGRPNRETSIMKPSELMEFRRLRDPLTLYRAHRPDEQDWISYTIFAKEAGRFALRRGGSVVKEYRGSKADAICLFLRRDEFEVLVLDKSKVEFVRELPVVVAAP